MLRPGHEKVDHASGVKGVQGGRSDVALRLTGNPLAEGRPLLSRVVLVHQDGVSFMIGRDKFSSIDVLGCVLRAIGDGIYLNPVVWVEEEELAVA